MSIGDSLARSARLAAARRATAEFLRSNDGRLTRIAERLDGATEWGEALFDSVEAGLEVATKRAEEVGWDLEAAGIKPVADKAVKEAKSFVAASRVVAATGRIAGATGIVAASFLHRPEGAAAAREERRVAVTAIVSNTATIIAKAPKILVAATVFWPAVAPVAVMAGVAAPLLALAVRRYAERRKAADERPSAPHATDAGPPRSAVGGSGQPLHTSGASPGRSSTPSAPRAVPGLVGTAVVSPLVASSAPPSASPPPTTQSEGTSMAVHADPEVLRTYASAVRQFASDVEAARSVLEAARSSASESWADSFFDTTEGDVEEMLSQADVGETARNIAEKVDAKAAVLDEYSS
ncbi:hypothetical protein [Frigoribacterium sp. VKM Ac-1396]|uniref:hypothetical protein n=1 Tax=Frigoribacterium sp. VKM Ac-1396 TaxID=2783821 RepID=UPI001E5B2433|nr:hypothetical protein [Frigoribacterium sp. VKM Ac-1396]